MVEPGEPRSALRYRGRRLPSICLIRRITGRRCPGCGMTRGFVFMYRFEPVKAWRANALAPALFVVAVRATAQSLKHLRRRPDVL
ncbi:MAG: DUF2752 domain-containing protein [Rubrobacter sp.]|nr:DUF2752 domain-containing protein [Rubrobacter sp.]